MTCETVCIGFDSYDDQPTLYSEVFRKARKKHNCCECRAVIQPGERYFRVKGIWDGRWDQFIQCLPCQEIQRTFSCGMTWLYGGLWEMWDDADAFSTLTIYDKCFQQLTFPTRAFLIDRWWKWLEAKPRDD